MGFFLSILTALAIYGVGYGQGYKHANEFNQRKSDSPISPVTTTVELVKKD